MVRRGCQTVIILTIGNLGKESFSLANRHQREPECLSDQRELAALNTRAAKAAPSYADLLARFKSEAAAMGLTSEYVQSLRQPVAQLEGDARAERKDDADLSELDHAELILELTLPKSVATTQEALALISEKATLGLVNPDSHRADDLTPKGREAQLAALAQRMSGSRAKGTTLDYATPACPAAQSMHAEREVRTAWGPRASWTKM